MQHKYQIPAIHDFIETYKDTPTFTFIHLAEYLHNDLNMAKHYDHDLANMLQSLHNSSALQNTFFLLVSDHGFQRSEPPFIFTNQGKTEINMPVFYLLPPTDFSTKHPDKYRNLIRNSRVLTTFFDINQMIRDVLSLATHTPVTQIFQGYEGHGESLFASLPNRSCAQAEVPEPYCSCLDGVSRLDPGAETLLALGTALLRDVNTYLQGIHHCQQLSLLRLDNASLKKSSDQSYLTFLLYAGQRQAIFEAQVRCTVTSGDSCSIGLTRLDWYSKTSGCLPHSLSHLSPFCICP